jgi:DNA repair ATPase RecN
MIDELTEELANMIGGQANEQTAMEKADRLKIDGTPLISISGNF